MIRRLFYMALGAAAAIWYQRERRPAAPPAPPADGEVVHVVFAAPARLFPSMVAGFGMELQAILLPNVLAAAAAAALPPPDDDGIDPATGLPRDGNPDDSPPEERFDDE